MQPNLPEVFIQRALATHLYSQGFQVREEVLFGGARFDIIASDGKKIVGFEVKVNSWNRAIQQSRIYKLCCDEVFLAIPESRLRGSIRDRCVEEDIGLVTIGAPPDWTCRTVVPAMPSYLRNPFHYASIRRIAAFR